MTLTIRVDAHNKLCKLPKTTQSKQIDSKLAPKLSNLAIQFLGISLNQSSVAQNSIYPPRQLGAYVVS